MKMNIAVAGANARLKRSIIFSALRLILKIYTVSRSGFISAKSALNIISIRLNNLINRR